MKIESITKEKLLEFIKNKRTVLVVSGVRKDELDETNTKTIKTLVKSGIDTYKFLRPMKIASGKETYNIVYIRRAKYDMTDIERKAINELVGIYELGAFLERTEKQKKQRSELERLSTNVADHINKILIKYNIITTVEYKGTSIKVVDNEGTYMWIRVMLADGKLRLQMSTIQLREELRRKGIFTEIFNKLKDLEYVYVIDITGVCTEEMMNWVTKNGLVPSYSGYDFTTGILR